MGKLEYKIKNAVQNKILKFYQNRSDVIILNEFEILNGLSRIDIAVLNKCFHGYEIKSDKDNLLRLPDQVANYNKIFDKMTLIVGYNHFYEAINIIPDWWGVKLYSEGPRGAIYFHEARRCKTSNNIDKVFLTQLLSKSDVVELLKTNKIDFRVNSKKKKDLAKIISDNTTLESLKHEIINKLTSKKNF